MKQNVKLTFACLIVAMCGFFICGTLPAQNSVKIVNKKGKTKAWVVYSGNPENLDSLKVKNKKSKLEDYVSYSDLLGDYVYSSKNKAFYDLKTSEKIKNDLDNRNRDNFYGDQYLNPFIQPNLLNSGNFDLSYYGSGDINQDDTLSFADYELILNSTLDQADVNGNGIPGEQSDKNLLYDYLIDEIKYLPAHFELNQTSTEKTNWFEKTAEIDSTNFHPPGPNWDCDQYAMQFGNMNENGIENISGAPLNWAIYDTTHNARFNLPVYQTFTISENNVFHKINAILVGDSVTNFSNWYFMEPQNDSQVFPGDPSMHSDGFANIEKYVYVWSDFLNDTIHTMADVIKFDLQNGNATITWQHPDLVETQPEYLTQTSIGGELPEDLTLEYGEDTSPSGQPGAPNLPNWAFHYWSDSTNQTGSQGDSSYCNYDIFRTHKGISNNSPLVDTTYGSFESYFLNISRPGQIIFVRDTESPTPTYVYPGTSMPFSQYNSSGIPQSQFTDNSGFFDQSRTLTSNQGSDPDSCNYYNFTVNVSDSAWDNTGNDTVVNFTVPVYLDDHYWDYFPPANQTEYADTITTNMTGGLPIALNPTGVPVITNPNPPQINSTQNPDPEVKEHYWYNFAWSHSASDTLYGNCNSTIADLQNVSVVETNPPYWTEIAPDTTVLEGEILHPDNLGWSTAEDSITPVTPEVSYWDELIEEVPNVYRLWERHWEAIDLCETTIDTSNFITEDLQTGISENSPQQRDLITVYPNPTADRVFLKIGQNIPEGLSLSLFNAYGVLVNYIHLEDVTADMIFPVELTPYPEGYYIILLSNENTSVSCGVVKKGR